jgi:hypothetical protein
MLYSTEFGFELGTPTEMSFSWHHVFEDELRFNMYTYFLLVTYIQVQDLGFYIRIC